MIKHRSMILQDGSRRQSDNIYYTKLSADALKQLTIPAGARYAIVTGDAAFFVSRDGLTFTLPTGDIIDGTGPVMVPANVEVVIDLQTMIDPSTASQKLGLRAVATPLIQIEWCA